MLKKQKNAWGKKTAVGESYGKRHHSYSERAVPAAHIQPGGAGGGFSICLRYRAAPSSHLEGLLEIRFKSRPGSAWRMCPPSSKPRALRWNAW